MSKRKSSKDVNARVVFILVSLVAIVITIFKGDMFAFARGPKPIPSPSPIDVSIITPNGGEKLVQGMPSTIKWKGGYRPVAIGLATSDADTNHAIALPGPDTPYSGPQTNGYTGKVLGFINNYQMPGYFSPDGTITWNGLKVCNFHLNLDPDAWCVDVAPGNYKIFVWSEGENGQSMCIGSGEGPTGKYTKQNSYGCNWDLSDQPFTILAP